MRGKLQHAIRVGIILLGIARFLKQHARHAERVYVLCVVLLQRLPGNHCIAQSHIIARIMHKCTSNVLVVPFEHVLEAILVST